MSRILRDHSRLVDETMRQAKKAGKRVQQRRTREERLDHRERRQALSATVRSSACKKELIMTPGQTNGWPGRTTSTMRPGSAPWRGARLTPGR